MRCVKSVNLLTFIFHFAYFNELIYGASKAKRTEENSSNEIEIEQEWKNRGMNQSA
jgi:hypothetical protein